MEYNDNKLANDAEYQKMSSVHSLSSLHEIDDLQEILNKMLEQKNNLVKNNSDGRYDDVLLHLSESIKNLQDLLTSDSMGYKQSNNQKKPTFSEFYNTYNPIKKLQNDPDSPSPIRGEMEMENFNSFRNNSGNLGGSISPSLPSIDILPRGTFDTINNGSNDSVTSPIRSGNEMAQNTTKRNSPMHGGPISNLIAKLNLMGKNKKRRNVPTINLDTYSYNQIPNNKFHNIFALNHNCREKSREVGCQIDLLRLLLLFMATRPHSRYYTCISSIATTQFEDLLSIWH